jgi:energy-coupling factor transporter ATP-binding protein EcfA2
MKKLIMLSGKKGVGKDTFMKFFNGFMPVAFADAVKLQVTMYLNYVQCVTPHIPISDFYDDKNKVVPIKFSEKEVSLRLWMQQYGQFAKSVLGSNYWADILIDTVLQDFPDKNIIITDARFPYEIDRVRQKMGHLYETVLIRINRNTGYDDADISETALDTWSDDLFDMVIDNNGTLKDLENKYILVMERFSI